MWRIGSKLVMHFRGEIKRTFSPLFLEYNRIKVVVASWHCWSIVEASQKIVPNFNMYSTTLFSFRISGV